VAVTCRVLGFSKQALYAWKRNPVSRWDWDEAHLINAALDIHHDDPAFGYRLIAGELAVRGIAAGENRVARLCSQQRIWSVFARKHRCLPVTTLPGPQPRPGSGQAGVVMPKEHGAPEPVVVAHRMPARCHPG
jgi:hypothetical protein